MRNLTVAALTLSLFGLASPDASAGEFDGWCVVEESGCGGISKIEEDEYGECEAGCTMYPSKTIVGTNATVYDVVCNGDLVHYSDRKIFLKYETREGEEKALFVDQQGAHELTRC